MTTNIGLFSYGFAALAYSLLALLVFFTRANRYFSWPILSATLFTALWATTIASSTLLEYPQVKLMQLTEIARNAAWCFVLLRFLGLRLQNRDHLLNGNRWIPGYLALFVGLASLLLLIPILSATFRLPSDFYQDVAFVIWMGMAIFGLLLLEQIYRNSTESERWSVKYLCLGLGVVFAYDFFMYAEALLFRTLDAALWQARGIVISLAAVFLAIAVVRRDREDNGQNLNLSRHVVFHSVTLLAAGIYLILMALVGYFIRYLGGTWAGVLQIVFLCASGLLLLALLFSGQIRAKTRVWLSKNFFSYKYDYRAEWLQFTRTLADGGENIPENIIRAMSHLTQSPSGLLWSKSLEGSYRFSSNWEMPAPDTNDDLSELAQWLKTTEWIIDLREWRDAPDVYEGLKLPTLLTDITRAWLVIPLLFGDELQGILLLRESELRTDINWEDRDLLKVAGRQAASHLAQFQANQALVESRQFEAFNRLSAYVIHDLKNILAQQSLIVSNAEKHKGNAEFMDDVIMTVRNSVERMTRLMEQMRSGVRGKEIASIDLNVLLEKVINDRHKVQPVPTVQSLAENVMVEADPELLGTVFSHLIQNAQEASDKNGSVLVNISCRCEQAVVEIRDKGTGMDANFIKTRLFMPFESTKGLTGMGIGAFESREFVRSLGGDISVVSTPGEGSVFAVTLPLRRSGSGAATTSKDIECD